MPAKKEFSTAEEAAEYIEFLRRRNRERAKEFYDNKIKLIPKNINNFWKNAENQVVIIITKIKICTSKFKNYFLSFLCIKIL